MHDRKNQTRRAACRPPLLSLGVALALFLTAGVALAQPVGPQPDLGSFVWLTKPNTELTDAEIQQIIPFRTVVLARSHTQFDWQRQAAEMVRIKAAADDAGLPTRVLIYFPAENRLNDATYGTCTTPDPLTGRCADGTLPFDDAWVVSCDPTIPPLSSGCGGVKCIGGRLVQETGESSGNPPVCSQLGSWVAPNAVNATGLTYIDWVNDTLDVLFGPHTTNVSVGSGQLTLGPYSFDGVMFDLAYGSARISNRVRNALGCSQLPVQPCVGDCPAEPGCPAVQLFEDMAGSGGLLGSVKEAFQDKVVLYNGLQAAFTRLRGACRQTESLDAVTNPLFEPVDGVHNEYFCYHREDFDDPATPTNEFRFQDRCNLERDLELQRAIARGEEGTDGLPNWVISKANYRRGKTSDAEQEQIASYCYGSYLLAHVEGFTTYKFGFGTVFPDVVEDAAVEETLGFGPALADYDTLGPNGLMVRHFENGWVVVNPNPPIEPPGTATLTFSAPESLEDRTGAPTTPGPSLEAGDSLNIEANTARFLLKPDVTPAIAACGPPEGAPGDLSLSHNRYTAGVDGLEWSRRLRAASDSACCEADNECALREGCYTSGGLTPPLDPLTGNDTVCADVDQGNQRFGPALFACDSTTSGQSVVDAASGVGRCCGTSDPQDITDSSGNVVEVLPAVTRFEDISHESCGSLETCSGTENNSRRMGRDFGADWSTALRHGKFEKCCDPQRTCNRDACYGPGTILPRQRDTDEICAGREAGGPLGYKPALYTCTAENDRVGTLFTDNILSTGATTPTQWCCTERSVNGNPVYVFDHPSHSACTSEPEEMCPDFHNRNSFWGPDLGTDWNGRDSSATVVYNRDPAGVAGSGCCNPAFSCNRDGQCYAPGALLDRLPGAVTHEVCAVRAKNAAGTDYRPAIYRCDASRVGETLSTPIDDPVESFCCQETVDPATDAVLYTFVPGACS